MCQHHTTHYLNTCKKELAKNVYTTYYLGTYNILNEFLMKGTFLHISYLPSSSLQNFTLTTKTNGRSGFGFEILGNIATLI